MKDFSDGIQKNFCFLAQRECIYCNNLGKCELTGYCYYKTSQPNYITTTTPNDPVYIKKELLPEVLIINGERYVKEHKT